MELGDAQAMKLADGRWELRVLRSNVNEPMYAIMGYVTTKAEASAWLSHAAKLDDIQRQEAADHKLPNLPEWPF
jgi:hypothetical protein